MSTMLTITRQMLSERRRSIIWYSIGLGLFVAMMAAFYPSIKAASAELDQYMSQLPASMQDSLGLAGSSITSPVGYLMSQLYTNMYPIIVMVAAIGLAAWCIAGSESTGTLEILLANPVTRAGVAVARAVGLALIVAIIIVFSTGVLQLLSPAVKLNEGLAWWALWSVALSMFAVVFVHAALAFAVGAATGQRGWAITTAAVVAFLGFAIQIVASASDSVAWLKNFSIWYWLTDTQPLLNAPGWGDTWVPLLLSVLLIAVGIWRFTKRDLNN